MKKHLVAFLTLFLYILTFKLYAQSLNDTTGVDHKLYIIEEISIKTTSDFNAKGAQKDIKEDNIRILFSGGFGGMPSFNNEKDIAFQKKYSVKFFSQGCIKMGSDENQEEYNQTIFNYLDTKFGEHWRNEIRNDAIGFK